MIVLLRTAQIELVLSHFNPIHTITTLSLINVSLSISLFDLEKLEAKLWSTQSSIYILRTWVSCHIVKESRTWS